MDKSGADGFRDDVLLMREVLEDWCALHGVRPDSPAAVKTASILLGQGRDLRRQQLLQALLEMAPANRPIGKPPLRQRESHVYGSQGAAAFVVSVLDICLSTSCDPVLSVSGVERR